MNWIEYIAYSAQSTKFVVRKQKQKKKQIYGQSHLERELQTVNKITRSKNNWTRIRRYPTTSYMRVQIFLKGNPPSFKRPVMIIMIATM